MAKNPKTPAPAPAETETPPATEATETVAKSIINSKYRGKYTADTKDWLAKLIDTHATATKDKKVTEGDGEGKVTKTIQVPDGVDIDKLHALAEKNGLDISKLKAQSESHGYAGRARMTIRNQLQTIAKQRHGLHGLDGKFHDAPADFLTVKSAPEKPTHDQGGTVIPKAAKPAEAAKAA